MTKKLAFQLLLFLVSCTIQAQSFSSIWNTNNTSTGSSAANEITIPTNPAFTTYNYDIDWGDGNTDTGVTGDITHTYAAAGTYTIMISGTFPSIYFNNTGDKLKIIEILSWGTIQWQTMENAFYGCENLNFDAIDSPDLSQVTSLRYMFRGGVLFNGIINNWDVSNITDISGMFYGASIFNRPLDNWTTNGITDMSETFRGASQFNEPLDNWNTNAVTNMSRMFHGASRFDQNINNWNVSQVTDMSGTFSYTNNFNRPLNNWNVSNVTDMSIMFDGSSFDQPIGNWNVSNVTNMSGMFRHGHFNQPIENWNVSSVVDMSMMFQRHRTFNQPLNNWNVSNVTNMSSMFDGWIWGAIYNQPLDNWDVSNVTNMSYMFRDNSGFNQSIGNWNTSNVVNMQGMFNNADVFNQSIDNWNVSSVTDMSLMFQFAENFNQPINSWNVANVENMSSMFRSAPLFNQPLNNWDVGNVTDMAMMFNQNPVFNQPLNSWNTGSVTSMNAMFRNANAFDQNLASWNISNVTNMSNMLSNSAMSQSNYDNTLIGWAGQTVQSNVSLGANGVNYCDGRDQRQDLIDNSNWNITGDIINCSFVLCTNLVSPVNGDTNVPASANLTWAYTPNATGYYVTVRIIRGGIESIPFNNHDVVGGNIVGLNLETPAGDDLLQPGDEVFVTVVPYNDTDGPAVGCTEESFTVVPSWVNSPAAFKLTYDTRLLDTGTTAANQLKIEANTGYPAYLSYNYSIDWGDDQFDNNVTGNITHTYLTPGIYTIAIIGDFPAPLHGYSNTDANKLISIDQWGTQPWQTMDRAFYYCENMEYNATDIPDLSNTTIMDSMFAGCDLFDGNIDNWDVSNITSMRSTFIGARAFNQPLNSWDVSSVVNMSTMFLATDAFNQPLNNWNTSSVTNMSRMFEQADVFNQNIDSWNVSNVTDMSSMFERAQAFNQPLNSWNVGNVVNMSKMFDGFVYDMVFNQPLNNWDVSNVTDMSFMFRRNIDFNQPIDVWNVSAVTNMASMFERTTVFNQPLASWNVGAVTNMNSMFQSAVDFNQPIDSWNVANVANMASMFRNSSSFNQPINSWNVSRVTTMQSMFENAQTFNQPLGNWDVNSVVDMSSMFESAEVFNQPLDTWDVSAVANMTSMFQEALVFHQPLNSWNVSSVTLMTTMFFNAAVFDGPISNWNVASVTSMSGMFRGASLFNQPIENWNTGEVLTMQEMFRDASAFNQPIDPWNVSFVNTMQSMFENATSFNQSLNSWNVASVTTTESMFKGATVFNQDIDAWNVRGINTMSEMFRGATAFNQSINSWRVSGVSNMNNMFNDASSYNQSMDQWNLGNVSMRGAFYNATALNQDLSAWNVSQVNDMSDMLDNTALTRENYDNTLIAWSEQTLTAGITLGAEGLPYCDAQEERQSMIDTFGWTFSLDVRDCPIPVCTQLASPLNGDTDVPVNTNLTWEPVLYAQGYRLTVGTTSGGNDIVNNATITNDTFYEFTSDFNTGDTVYVTLIPFNDEGDAVGPCIEESFTISNNPATVPDCTNLTLPLHAATDVLITTDLEWAAISNADGYRLTVGTTSGGSDILANEDVGNVTEYDFTTDLPEDQDIFVTLVPYNDQGDATSCTEESFHTELIPVPPVCTNLTSPVNGATGVPIDTEISWSAVSNATGYLVVIGTTMGGIEVANNIDVGNATTYTIPSNLQEDRTHYVTIIPYNDEGDATGCTEENFRTGNSSSPPSCVSLTTPADGAIGVALDTNLSWNTSGTADGYHLRVGTTTGGTEIFNADVGDVTTYDLPTDLPQGTVIYVDIVPYNSNGSASGCIEDTFTTAGPPVCTTLSSPLNNAVDIAVDTDLAWNAIANADGYRVTVMASSSTANNSTYDVTGTTLDLPNDFEQGETVTVTIVPYNAVGDASGCTTESFTIKPVPGCTTLSAPSNGAVDVPLDTDISWNAVTDANGYRITVTASSSTINNITNVDIPTGTSYNFTNDFEQGETVTVTIVPYNEVGEAIGCTSESFTIKSVPNCTSLITPLNGSTVTSASEITWATVAGANGYRLTVTGSTTSTNNETDLVVTGTSHNFANQFAEGETVSVTIVPFNEIGDATGCPVETFTIIPVPSCTNLVAPLNGATDVSVTTDIEWSPSPYAEGYRISVGTSPNGNEIVDNEDVASLTNYTLAEDLPSETLIYVSIIPYNASGEPTACTSESFETEIVLPNCTVLAGPFNGEEDVPLETSISWEEIQNAEGYRLSIGTTSGGTDLLNNQDMGASTNYLPSEELPYNTEIYVSITPYNSIGDAAQCTEQSFTTHIPEDETEYGFSPDGDGINEYWHIENIDYHPINVVTIYNRWGDAVFRVENYDNQSAAFRGEANLRTKMGAGKLPEGTYFFDIQIEGESTLRKTKGFLVLKR